MCRSPITVCPYSDDLGFELRDPHAQFIMRKAVERLRGQLAGQISSAARALVEFHCLSLCGRFSLAVNLLHRYLAKQGVYHLVRRKGRDESVQGAWHEAVTSDDDRNRL
jgi:hypothetical protein